MILELILPELNGVGVLRTLRSELREARFLVYSGAHSSGLIMDALKARPHGFVHKSDSLPTFCEALRAVHQGCCYFTRFATRLIDTEAQTAAACATLTDRERAILQMIAEGMNKKEMADLLSIAPKTVENHRTHVMQKLGIRNVATLTRYAIRLGLVQVEDC